MQPKTLFFTNMRTRGTALRRRVREIEYLQRGYRHRAVTWDGNLALVRDQREIDEAFSAKPDAAPRPCSRASSWAEPIPPGMWRTAGDGAGSGFPLQMVRRPPGSSVTDMLPPGRNARQNGYSRFPVPGVTRVCAGPASSSVGSLRQSLSCARPVGADGNASGEPTFCWPNAAQRFADGVL